MSDNFERVKTEILKRSLENGGVTTGDLLEAIEATNTDNDEAHDDIIVTLTNATEKLALMEEASLDVVGAFSKVTKTDDFKKLMVVRDNIVDDKIAIHVVSLHPLDEEGYDMRKAWRTVKWALIVIAGGVLVALADQIGHLIFGGAT